MTVKVDNRKWDALAAKLRDGGVAIVSSSPYAQVAAEAASEAAGAVKLDPLDPKANAAALLQATQERCPVDTGALRASLGAEHD